MGPEAKVERAVCAAMRKRGVLVLKLFAYAGAQRGWPDRLFLHRGRCAFVEFKAPGRKPTPLQMSRLGRLAGEGFHATWIDDAERGVEWITEALNLHET